MSETPTGSAEPLQFDRIESAGEVPEGLACQACSTPLHDHYFEVNGLTVCERCRYSVEESFAARGGPGAFLKATLFGLGGGLLGAAVYYAVLVLLNLELSLLSILVGWLAGTGVAKGSGRKGGWVYQTLAVGITYFCIIATYVPLIVQEFKKQAEAEKPAATAPAPGTPAAGAPAAAASATPATAPADAAAPASPAVPAAPRPADPAAKISAGDVVVAIAALFLIAAIAPFLQGASSILGLLIIFFGLLQAWRLNRKVALTIQGPFQIRASGPAGLASLPAPAE